MKPLLPLVCALLLGPCIPNRASANGGGYVTGVESTGAFKPLGIQQVEMLSEKLDIDLHIEHAEVRIEYILHNAGPKVTVEAGFPSAAVYDYVPSPDTPPPGKAALSAAAALKNFQLTADGKTVKSSVKQDSLALERGDAPSWGRVASIVKAWHVFKLDFAAGQTRRLQVRYRNPYYCGYSSVSDNVFASPLTLTYLFSSAAAWKGPIQQGVVTVRALSANPDDVQFNLAKRFKREGKLWQWSFTDFEPTLEDDLVITTRPHTFGSYHFVHDPEGADDDFLHTAYMGRGAKGDFERNAKAGGTWELWRYDYSARASSTLAPQGELRYDASLVALDKDEGSAWVEGVKGDGIGESVTLTLQKPANVRRVGLVNGYAKDEGLYERNNRIARLDVSVNGGKPFSVEVPDECLKNEKFFFDLLEGNGAVKTVKLTIAAVHKGTKYDDTCLSEVVLVVPLSKRPEFRHAR